MFERLQQLPLFMGLGINDLLRIVEEVKFSFEKWESGDIISNQGDRCDKIVYVLSGSLCATYRDDVHGFQMSEYFDHAYYIIEPQNLWGMRRAYGRSYSFTTDGSTCSISKDRLLYLLSHYDIIKTNLLSLICNRLQNVTKFLHNPIPFSTSSRILRYIKSYKIYDGGKTVLLVKMPQLATLTSSTRLNVSKVLNTWNSEGLITLQRGLIIIDDMSKLETHIVPHNERIITPL